MQVFVQQHFVAENLLVFWKKYMCKHNEIITLHDDGYILTRTRCNKSGNQLSHAWGQQRL